MTFRAIAERLGINPGTVERAYWSMRREDQAAAFESGKCPPSSRHVRIGLVKLAQIREAAAHIAPDEIARKVRVSVRTVHRELRNKL